MTIEKWIYLSEIHKLVNSVIEYNGKANNQTTFDVDMLSSV